MAWRLHVWKIGEHGCFLGSYSDEREHAKMKNYVLKWKLTCPVSPQHAPWGFGIAAPLVWSASGSPVHTSSAPPHSGETHAENISRCGFYLVVGWTVLHTKAPLTFLKPSKTPFMFSYLLKRSAKERSTELRSAIAWSLSAVNCLTDLLQDRVFCCWSSSANITESK